MNNNTVANIIIENNNINQTQLLIEQFKDFNIEIYGTFDEPLFKAKDIGDLLEIKDIRTTLKKFDKDEGHTMPVIDSLGRLQETNMLTEQGLYKMLMISRKPIAKEFQKWVFNMIKQIRLNSNKQLENKIKQLEFHKVKSYEPLLLEETVYCHSTDIEGISKVGKCTKNNSKTRKYQSQTPCVKDIKILYEVKTSNCDLLEKLVHHSLDYHRLGRREHFRASLDHIKFVMNTCNKFVNVIGGIRQSITPEEFIEKLGTSIVIDKIVEKELIIEKEKIVEKIVNKVVYKNKYINNSFEKIDLEDINMDELFPEKVLIEELN
jgi:prophage antirepressor-like protein